MVAGGSQCRWLRAEAAALLLDVDMPAQNGLRTLRAVRCGHGLIAMPVMIVTSHREVGYCGDQEIGADDFISKPFRSGEFASKMKWLITIIL
ncbi:response regulator [Nitrospirillum sp. BR 11163]|uniref:response regulator n=1 Tax=Nitrospirillum sp. BR 11163 TaxID=3104323 RepID=UPI003A4C7BAF